MTDEYEFTLGEETRLYAEEALNETVESRTAGLEEIGRWLKEERPDLNAKTETKYLLPFLRGCKFNLEKTKQKIINYYTMRRDEPIWFKNRNPLLPEVEELVRLGIFLPLRQTSDGRLVIIIRTAAHNPSIHSLEDIFKVGKMILDIAVMESESCQIYGGLAIFDMSGVTIWHAKQMTINIIRRAVFAWQNYTIRPKRLDFINAPIYINLVLSIFKSFMTQKMKSRVRVIYGGAKSLYKEIDRDILPSDYGGKGESVKELSKYWYEKLVQYQDWFAEDEKYAAK
ncbi:unnamed protein product [Acanthoscelides obtectus]|uniref:CRAL-TRIO domain-containing protein n=1 Tax=Acanthoscelides obtectus TaxID=200917 RepID=A0A9P0VP33_ACAOB|nr:unnamed protein product [Acanthoscelides obtectus]CAK1684232.1 Retinol-binding protein pinta [Acanthoscelides obtectus]